MNKELDERTLTSNGWEPKGAQEPADDDLSLSTEIKRETAGVNKSLELAKGVIAEGKHAGT